MKICGIYQIINKINNKIYIGSSIDVEQRWNTHKRELRSKKHHNKNLQNAWHEYGEENFVFEIIELVEDTNQLIDKEQYYIDSTKCCDSDIGYNVSPTAGNCLGVKRTEEEKRWLSKINSGEKSHFAKITEKDAIKICKRIVSGESIRSIARDYPKGIVLGIKRGETWKNISKDYLDYFPKKEKKMSVKETKKVLTKEEKKEIRENNKAQKEKMISEQILKSYIHFIDSIVKEFSVTKSFIDKSITEYDKYVNKTDKKEIVGKERTNKKSNYLFSGLIKCRDCSHNYRGKMYRKNAVYICLGHYNRKTNCERFAIHEKDILNAIDIHFKSSVIDLNLVDFIDVESKTVKIYYTDGSYSVL